MPSWCGVGRPCLAQAIKSRREYLAREIVIERPDSTRVVVLSYATPLLAEDGNVASAMNIRVNISDRKHVENLLDSARETRDFYRAALADALREQLDPMRTIVTALSPPWRDSCVSWKSTLFRCATWSTRW